jgi:hypothetical protein
MREADRGSLVTDEMALASGKIVPLALIGRGTARKDA